MRPGTRAEPAAGRQHQDEDGGAPRFRPVRALVAALMIAVLLLASMAGFRFLEAERLPGDSSCAVAVATCAPDLAAPGPAPVRS